ncbi:MAG: hypothetical protein ACYDAK_05330 [Candidatus Limnocylindrales bacterium]
MTAISTAALVDGVARVVAGAIPGAHIFAAGVTASVIAAAPLVVPVVDDFTEGDLPAVTCVLGAWHPILQPGNERYGDSNPLQILCAVWRARVDLTASTQALYADRDAIADALIAHAKAFMTDLAIQAVILEGGPGIVPRSIPTAQPGVERTFLTLPFTVNLHLNRVVVPQPA